MYTKKFNRICLLKYIEKTRLRMVRKLSSFDEFLNGKNLSEDVNNANENVNIVVHSQTPQKSETMFLTDKEGVKYELYEFKKEVSGLPTDIFIGYKK